MKNFLFFLTSKVTLVSGFIFLFADSQAQSLDEFYDKQNIELYSCGDFIFK